MFPAELQQLIQEQAADIEIDRLRTHAQVLSERYRNQSGTGKRLLTENVEAASYALVRMPATYAAVQAALEWTLACCDCQPQTVLDCGAGTGAASWAAAERLPIQQIHCLERQPAMQQLGEKMMHASENPALRQAVWQSADLTADHALPAADLVVSAYVMNEMNAQQRTLVVQKLWQAARQLLLIVEPGTPAGYQQLMETRKLLLEQGAFLAAPCPHSQPCRLPQDEWCHALVRVQRSRLHRMLKDGDAPYEDEKFMYLAFTREPAMPVHRRVLRHPQVQKGMITLSICDREENHLLQVRKKDAEYFRAARKAGCGDAFPE